MKVKIINRIVYHKYAEIFIEVPNGMECNDIHEYLTDNENLYVDKINQAINDAEYEYRDSEYRFEYQDVRGGDIVGGDL